MRWAGSDVAKAGLRDREGDAVGSCLWDRVLGSTTAVPVRLGVHVRGLRGAVHARGCQGILVVGQLADRVIRQICAAATLLAHSAAVDHREEANCVIDEAALAICRPAPADERKKLTPGVPGLLGSWTTLGCLIKRRRIFSDRWVDLKGSTSERKSREKEEDLSQEEL
ncbi:hypothetical protein JZ751_019818 [Albula glossodonta]|uniref:Uncharacterized protein n=1 Tax=Albula glossodonta TaxID=121402 RepID=A0A8T2NLZ4_9TELE|nr:hypothetical protein JZ751_019818 [Albula glossodonta]